MSETQSPAGAGQARVVALVGPTAVGKTAAAIALAEAVSGEVISADSRYLYRGLDIGTAKPCAAELARVPHHLINVTTPDQPWSLAEYQRAAYAAIDAVLARGHLPLLVGGTGQYVRAVTDGWQMPPGEPSGALRAELERELAQGGVEALAERLRQVDAPSAAQVDLRNPRRVIRALEVALSTGSSFAAQRRKTPPPFETVWLGLWLPRPELYARIDARVDGMLAAGLVAEVERLVSLGYGWELPAMSAVGYRQIGAYLRGECSLDEAARQIKRATRQFVRRQANWFKSSDPAIHWFRSGPDAPTEMAAWRAAGLPEPARRVKAQVAACPCLNRPRRRRSDLRLRGRFDRIAVFDLVSQKWLLASSWRARTLAGLVSQSENLLGRRSNVRTNLLR